MPGADLSWLTPSTTPTAPNSGKGLIASLPGALWGGLNEGASQLWSGVRAVADLTGSNGVSDFAANAEAANRANAAAVANPDYEGSPFAGGVGHALPWLAYNAVKMAPTFGLFGLARAAEAPALAERALSLGAKAEAPTALAQMGRGMVALAPTSLGQAYQATEGPDGQGNAPAAFMMAPALAGLNSWLPGHVSDILANAGEGGLKSVATHALVTGAAQAPIAGAQQAILDGPNPNLSLSDRVHNIVQASVSGAVLGAGFGAGAGLGGIRGVKPGTPTADIGSVVDEAMAAHQDAPAPSPQALPAPSMYTDSAGRAAYNPGDLMAAPRDTGMSPTDRMMADATVPQAQPALEGWSAINQDKQGSLRWVQPYDGAPPSSTGLGPMTTPELEMAHRVLTTKADGSGLNETEQRHLDLVKQELDFRNTHEPLTNGGVQNAAGTVERSADGKSGVADQGSSAPVPTPTLDDALKGITTRKSYADAKDLDEVKARLIDRLQNGSTAKGDLALADRLGVDTNAPDKAVETTTSGVSKPDDQAALANDNSKTPEPAAPANSGGGDTPVDADFQKQFLTSLGKKEGPALDELRANPPANQDDAFQRLYDELGKNTADSGDKPDGYEHIVDLAKQHGVLNDDGRYTDAALELEKTKPISMADTVAEAQARGLGGDETSAFDRGARGEQQDKFGSIAELKAYQDGTEWGKDRRVTDLHPGATDAQTKEVQGSLRDTRPNEDAQRTQFLNQAIDQVYGSTVRPQEQAQLKRMVREGAAPKQIDDAARYFATGRGALVQEQPAAKPFRGEVVTRGAPRDPDKLQALRNAGVLSQKGEAVAKSETAIAAHQQRKQLLSDEITGAHLSGDISTLDRFRLQALLGKNDLQGVIDRLPGGRLHGAGEVDTGHFMNALAERAVIGHEYNAPDRISASPALRLKLMSGDASGALKEVAANSASPLSRLIARKLDGDWLNKVTLSREAYDPQRTGRTELNADGSSVVKLFGDRGMSEETFLHEMIHAFIHQKWLGGIEAMKGAGSAIVDKVNALHDQIRNAIEKAYPELTNNAIWADQVHKSPDEMITWVMTNPEAQEALKHIDINGNKIDTTKSSLWDQFKGFVGDLLGIPSNGRTMSALDHILQAGHGLLDAKEQVDAAAHVPTPMVNDRLTATVKLMADKVGPELRKLIDPDAIRSKLFKAALNTQPLTHITEVWDFRTGILPVGKMQMALNQRQSIRNTLPKVGIEVGDAAKKLERDNPKDMGHVKNLMLAALSGIDGEKTWKEQTWLHKDPRAGQLKEMADDANRSAKTLTANGNMAVYHALRDSMRSQGTMQMLQRLHLMAALDPTLKDVSDKLGDPMMDYIRDGALHNPAAASKYWFDSLNKAISTLEGHFRALRGDPTLVAPQRTKNEQRIGPIEQAIKETKDNLGLMQQRPYFHSYREGNHMAAGTLRTLEDGSADPKAAKIVSDVLNKYGFTDVNISPALSNPKIFMRLDTQAQRDLAGSVMAELAKKGLMDADSVKTGPLARAALMTDGSKAALEHMFGQIDAHPMFATEGLSDADKKTVDDHRAAIKDMMKESWLNTLPENSVSRVMAHRDMVQGNSTDMVKGALFRMQVGDAAAARIWARPHINDAFTEMEGIRRNSMHVGDKNHQYVDKIHDVVNNLRQRDISQAAGDQHDWTDFVRTWSSVYHIGASPAMVLVDGSQLGVLTLPQLGARHGYAATFTSMAKAAPVAFRILREALKQGWAVSATRAADANITRSVLEKAMTDKSQMQSLEHVLASGRIDIGSNTRSMTSDSGLVDNPTTSKMLRYSAGLAQYTETLTRLITALTAMDLHGVSKMSGSREDYAGRVLDNTLGQYDSSNAAPIMSKKGPFGKFGPMMFQFKQFELNLIWKLYREVHTGFADKEATQADKEVARRFLAGHLMAVTALAGTLGMPFAAAAAGAVDRLKDEFWGNDHPFDATAEYRNFLANIFGKQVGEVIAKGVPRSLDFDLSGRVGEQDLLPATELLTSRQKWSDVISQWQEQSLGAPASMLIDQAKGLDQIHNGNVLGGMATMMPTAFRNPLHALQMTARGYVDAQGNKMPMASPGAADVLVQLLGLNPEPKAEMSDEKEIQMETRASLTRTANSLKAQLIKAYVSGNTDTARALVQRAAHFDAANPSYAVLPRLSQDVVNYHREQAQSVALGTPIGVNPKDTYARGLTSGFSTIDYQAH